MTALSNRADPIPKIVARANEVFLSRGNYPLWMHDSKHFEFHRLLKSLPYKNRLALASYEYCAGLAESYWNAIV